MNWLLVEENVKRALNEDLQYGDITTESVVLDHKIAKVDIIAKEKKVIAVQKFFKMVFKILGDVEVDFSVNDGEEVEKGQHFGQVSGDAKKKNSYGRKSCSKLYAKNVWNSNSY